MIVMMALIGIVSAGLLAFTFGRATADRQTNLNHHQMMMMLMDLRVRDDTVPIMPADTRSRLDHLLAEYEHLDLDESRV